MSASLFDDLPDVLKTLRALPLLVMRLDSVIVPLGGLPGADRRGGVVHGGVFEGERLSGAVLDGGADWQILAPMAPTLDVRLILKTNEGALIGMSYRGLRHGPPDVLAKIARGEPVDAASYYFRIAPLFETASEKYGWLNRVLAVGIGHRRADGPTYSVFEVL